MQERSRRLLHFSFCFFIQNIFSKVTCGPLFLWVFLVHLHQGAAEIGVLCSTFSFFSSPPLLILIMNLKQRMKLLKHFGSLPSEPPPPLLLVPVSGICCRKQPPLPGVYLGF